MRAIEGLECCEEILKTLPGSSEDQRAGSTDDSRVGCRGV